MYESHHGESTKFTGHFPENSKRAKRQQQSPIRVVISNPPYSAQQQSENDNNQNLEYPALDNRIRTTYAKASNAKLLKNLYDSYIRAIRWASDRINDRGVVGFVTNGSFIDANNMDGLRACLTDEFTSVYTFNLRGNARTQGEERRKEKGNVFGGGTRTPVAITLLVKNPDATGPCQLHYHDIGDYLSRDEKLKIIRSFASINGIAKAKKWKRIDPNPEHDWINQRDPAFDAFIPLGDKENYKGERFFDSYTQGLLTSRDKWCYNFGRGALENNMRAMIKTYNDDQPRVLEAIAGLKRSDRDAIVSDMIDADPKRISWSRALKQDITTGKKVSFRNTAIVHGSYRPYGKQWVYFDRILNEFVYQLPSVFPEGRLENMGIFVTGGGASKDFSALMTDCIPNYHMHDTGQCFPFYLYDKLDDDKELDFDDGKVIDGYRRRDAITDAILKTFQEVYGKKVTKEDIFYYVYGILHSPEYRERFAADLKKMLPRIPLTKEAGDFRAFSGAGRELADWHLNYETVEPWPVVEHSDKLGLDPAEVFKVRKMTFARPTAEQKAAGEKWDKSRIIYNSHLTISHIPLEAYEYVVNGKPAIQWVMERYQVTRDKNSGIVNDPNDWCKEHDNPRYIVDLIARVVRVSMEILKIVKTLPPLNEKK